LKNFEYFKTIFEFKTKLNFEFKIKLNFEFKTKINFEFKWKINSENFSEFLKEIEILTKSDILNWNIKFWNLRNYSFLKLNIFLKNLKYIKKLTSFDIKSHQRK